MAGIVEWLFKHPPFLIAALLFVVVLFVAWLVGPISWRDGEGSPAEDGRGIRDVWDWLRWW